MSEKSALMLLAELQENGKQETNKHQNQNQNQNQNQIQNQDPKLILIATLQTTVNLNLKNNELCELQEKHQQSTKFNFDDIRIRHKQDLESLQNDMNEQHQVLFDKFQKVLQVNIKLAQENAELQKQNEKISKSVESVENELVGIKKSLALWKQSILSVFATNQS